MSAYSKCLWIAWKENTLPSEKFKKTRLYNALKADLRKNLVVVVVNVAGLLSLSYAS